MARFGAAFAVVSLTALGSSPQPGGAQLRFKEEAVVIRYSATERLASLVFEAECEQPFGAVEVCHRSGQPGLGLVGGDARSSLSGFVIESAELELDELLELYPRGAYAFRGRSVDGRAVRGSGLLSHELPAPPMLLQPAPDEAGVPPDGLVVRWTPDPAAAGYHIVLEQGDNDGLQVSLPAGRGSFQVPDGLLAGGTETHLELAAVASNGNSSQVELVFTTR